MTEFKQEKQHVFDKIKGCMYGVAIGDSLGATVEFMDMDRIRREYGRLTEIIGGGHLGVKPGTGTDDTAMTLAVAEGLMACGPEDDPVEMIGECFVSWYNDYPIGIGGICYTSISLASQNGRISKPSRSAWLSASEVAHKALAGRSAGNGTLMRTAPVALFGKDRKTILDLAFDVSEMTHYDLDAGEACYLYCLMLSKLIRGQELHAVLRQTLEKTEYANTSVEQPNPSGYVKDTFRTVLWAAARAKTFEDALITVVNEGGDADTTGAICGGLVGAAYGFSAIPDRWVRALDPALTARLDSVVKAAAKVW